jgi:hypothetical protein
MASPQQRSNERGAVARTDITARPVSAHNDGDLDYSGDRGTASRRNRYGVLARGRRTEEGGGGSQRVSPLNASSVKARGSPASGKITGVEEEKGPARSARAGPPCSCSWPRSTQSTMAHTPDTSGRRGGPGGRELGRPTATAATAGEGIEAESEGEGERAGESEGGGQEGRTGAALILSRPCSVGGGRRVAVRAARASSARGKTTARRGEVSGPAGLGQCTVHLVQSSLAFSSFLFLFFFSFILF